MTTIEVGKPQNIQEKHQARTDAFWDQTVAENNARLNNKNISADALDEIKFIQSVLLTQLNPQDE